MPRVILEVQLWPGERKHDELYFCKEVDLPMDPTTELEFMLDLGNSERAQFEAQFIQWIESTGHILVRLRLTEGWDEVPEEAFDLTKWKKGTYWDTFR